MQTISIRGARTHNLKNISLDIPKNKLVVITGLSGSGKSSLAFDTLYAEGQRRYVESLSAYARQFLQLMQRPEVDLISGLSPAIAIEQKSASQNPRSTVGTITEVHDYLRLLYARVGTPYCPIHNLALQSQSINQMVEKVLSWPQSSRVAILAPLARNKKGSFESELNSLSAQGFVRVRVNGKFITLDELQPLNKNEKHDIDLVVDRLKINSEQKQRIAESLETCINHANGRAIVLDMDTGNEHIFSLYHACTQCDYGLIELEPRLFSFNNPSGACSSCAGLGNREVFDPDLVVAFPDLSLASGAVYGWDRRNSFTVSTMTSLAQHYGFDIDTPFNQLEENTQQKILYGSDTEVIDFFYMDSNGKPYVKPHTFEGVIPNLERRWEETDTSALREELNKLRVTITCPECRGTRLRQEARNVFIDHNDEKGLAIYEVEALSLKDCLQWFKQLSLTGSKHEIASKIITEIQSRLEFLNNVGLKYLSLDRSANTISGGEAQRIRLASQIGSGLTGVMYVLDEPSIGLHQRDNGRLIKTLQQLRDLGNSVIVVEHDEDMIKSADHVIDMGPGAGEHGGEIIAQGSYDDIKNNSDSLTGKYLNNTLNLDPENLRIVTEDTPRISITGCTGNNLKSVDLSIPTGKLVCISGVSGSGKSTLINHTLAKAVSKELHRSQAKVAPFNELIGIENFDKIITVDQSAIGRTPRSNPATYTGMFTAIRELFAGVPEARARGYGPGRFSFNVKGGRCEACQGDGVVKVEMHFLPDMYVNCDVCNGKRYNKETLDIHYRGLNISEILNLTVEQALQKFEAIPNIARRLQTLEQVGLSYIRLGQSATTLSGGEAQRVKLSLELSKRDTGKTLYILDEPTTGLHFHDIAMLLKVINQLVDAGNTVVIIEHNIDVIKASDWVIDLGPEGGTGGGYIIAQGTPQDIASNPDSYTGRWLA